MASNFKFTMQMPGNPPQSGFGGAGDVQATPALRPYDLFVTRIWQARLSFAPAQLQAWVDEVLALREASPKPAGRTNRQGWNSEDMSLLERPTFAPLRQMVRAGCAAALRELGQDGL